MENKKRVMKKAMAAIMAAAMLMTGCSGGGSGTASTDKGTQPAASGAEVSKAAADTSAADTSTEAANEAPIDTSKEVELVMYLVGSEPARYGEILEKFNEKLKNDINATLTVKWLSWGDYLTKYPLVLSSGESIDLIYSANWIDFYQHAANGAFLPLNDLLPVYCPKSFANYPTDVAFPQTSIDGEVYAYGSTYSTYSTYGAFVRGDLMKKYGIDSISTFDEYGDYLKNVAKQDPDLVPMMIVSTKGSQLDDVYLSMYGMYPLTGNNGSFYQVDPADPEGKVFCKTDWDKMPEFLAKMNEWSDAGCWSKSALSNQDKSLFSAGKAASRLGNYDQYVGDYINAPERDVQFVNFTKNLERLSYTQDAMSIPISAKNPERALMMLDLILTDPSYYNLLAYGIEGETYRFDENNFVEALDPANFPLESGTSAFRTPENNHFKAGSPASITDDVKNMEKNAVSNKYRAFVMDTTNVKNEYAAVQNVISQYYNPLKLGYTDDFEKDFENLKEQLRLAGNDKVIAEFQKQVDEFNKNNP